MKKTWFWATIVFWFILAGAFVGRALIFSPDRFSPKTICQYESTTNGVKETNRVWVNEGRLKSLLPIITNKFRSEGWTPEGRELDLTPLLLELSEENPSLEGRLEIHAFKKAGATKALGLLENPSSDTTYGWEGELPDSVFNPSQSRSSWNFPFTPPEDSRELFCQKLMNFRIGLIYLDHDNGLYQRFSSLCLRQGFRIRPWRGDPEREVFLLSKPSFKLLAVLNPQPLEDVIALVSLN